MKPELNEQLKEKFYAQYWGQEVAIIDGVDEPQPVVGSIINYAHKSYLSLRPLSSMTDEEILTLCTKVYPLAFQGNNPPKKWEVTIHHTGHATVKNKNNDYSFSVFLMDGSVDVYQDGELTVLADNHSGLDYLRSQGFMTDFMGYQWKELISAGYCKIQEVKQ